MKITYSHNEFHSDNGALLGWLLPDTKTELKQKILSVISKILERHGHSLEVKEVPNKFNPIPLHSYYHSVTAGINDSDWRWVTFYTKWENKMPCIKSVVKVYETVLRE